jgi:hypothetical protein
MNGPFGYHCSEEGEISLHRALDKRWEIEVPMRMWIWGIPRLEGF